MPQFKDVNGKAWDVNLDINALRRVRDLCGFDLADITNEDGKAISKIEHDPILLVDILYCICKPQADDADISDRQFGEGFTNGDIIAGGTEALLKALADFSRSPIRKVLTRAIAQAKNLEAQNNERLDKILSDPEFDLKIKRAMAKEFGIASGNAPESSESTPEAGH